MARGALGDTEGEIADYDRAIQIDPEYVDAYYNRGIARTAIGDQPGATADFLAAASRYQQQGKERDYQDALEQLKKL